MCKLKEIKNCLNCHFLCSEQTHPTLGYQSQIISKQVRKRISDNQATWPITYQTDLSPTAFCYLGHWKESDNLQGAALYKMLTVPHKKCFYNFQEMGVSLEKAHENWKGENARKSWWLKQLSELGWKVVGKILLGILSVSIILKFWNWLALHIHYVIDKFYLLICS
ncbi:MAG: hypothetical protein K0S08_444 [Gammaproteobacteria bacterium]|jgi:hypothetical protein|nr:hypothetical protein [Gammaproteobacteria bacterium]